MSSDALFQSGLLLSPRQATQQHRPVSFGHAHRCRQQLWSGTIPQYRDQYQMRRKRRSGRMPDKNNYLLATAKFATRSVRSSLVSLEAIVGWITSSSGLKIRLNNPDQLLPKAVGRGHMKLLQGAAKKWK